jgi:hypothetical protein
MNLIRSDHKLVKSAYWLRHVFPSACPFLHIQKLSSHWTDIHEILHLSIFRKSFDNIKV